MDEQAPDPEGAQPEGAQPKPNAGVRVPKQYLSLENLHMLDDGMTQHIDEQICAIFEHAERYFRSSKPRSVSIDIVVRPVTSKTGVEFQGFDVEIKPKAHPKVPAMEMDSIRSRPGNKTIITSDGEHTVRTTGVFQPGSPDDPNQEVFATDAGGFR